MSIERFPPVGLLYLPLLPDFESAVRSTTAHYIWLTAQGGQGGPFLHQTMAALGPELFVHFRAISVRLAV